MHACIAYWQMKEQHLQTKPRVRYDWREVPSNCILNTSREREVHEGHRVRRPLRATPESLRYQRLLSSWRCLVAISTALQYFSALYHRAPFNELDCFALSEVAMFVSAWVSSPCMVPLSNQTLLFLSLSPVSLSLLSLSVSVFLPLSVRLLSRSLLSPSVCLCLFVCLFHLSPSFSLCLFLPPSVCASLSLSFLSVSVFPRLSVSFFPVSSLCLFFPLCLHMSVSLLPSFLCLVSRYNYVVSPPLWLLAPLSRLYTHSRSLVLLQRCQACVATSNETRYS